MPDFRTFYDQEHLGSWDLPGNVTLTISAVKPGEVGGHQGKKKDRKPILSFEGKSKTMVCNKTNAKTIAGMYGNDVKNWIGKRITLYPTTTPFGGEMKDCIRIKAIIPKQGKQQDEHPMNDSPPDDQPEQGGEGDGR